MRAACVVPISQIKLFKHAFPPNVNRLIANSNQTNDLLIKLGGLMCLDNFITEIITIRVTCALLYKLPCLIMAY